MFAALSALEMEDLTETRKCLQVAEAIYGDGEFFYYSELRFWSESMLHYRLGRGVEAVEKLNQIAFRILSLTSPFAAFVLQDLCEVAASCRKPQTARIAAETLEEIASKTQRTLFRALSALGRSWSRLTEYPEDAAELAEEAVHMFGSLGCKGYRGRAFDVLGRAFFAADATAAATAFELAAAAFETCGATWRRDRSLEALRSLGYQGRRFANNVMGASSLTRREREVARLAAHGYSSREIAERLSIADRTVEWHLSNAYSKLGIDSRHELSITSSRSGFPDRASGRQTSWAGGCCIVVESKVQPFKTAKKEVVLVGG